VPTKIKFASSSPRRIENAPDEESAIKKVIEEFKIATELQNRLLARGGRARLKRKPQPTVYRLGLEKT
jgi:hypothetical protein